MWEVINRRRTNKAFSLIELMVVVAIVAVLSMVAVPFYKDYTIKAKIARNISIAEKIVMDAKVHYQMTGSYPSSIVFNGATLFPTGIWVDINFGDIRTMHYFISPDGRGFRVNISLNGLEGIPGYTAPATIPINSHSVILFAVRDLNGVMQMACGQSSAANITNLIPLDYLPAGCKCTGVGNFVLSGTPC